MKCRVCYESTTEDSTTIVHTKAGAVPICHGCLESVAAHAWRLVLARAIKPR